MPGRDGTGPIVLGTMSGRGMGYCPGANTLSYGLGRRLGRGYGMGVGLGYGRRRGPWYDEKELLLEQKRLLERRLNYVQDQLESFSEINK